MYCLDSLFSRLDEHARAEIVVYEPSSILGAGNVYDPSQPDFLRMNFASRHINAWSLAARRDPNRLSLVHWLSRYHCDQADPDGYVSRSLVGSYLSDCFCHVRASAPEQVVLRHDRQHVQNLYPERGKWVIQVDDRSETFDQVLLTVGHQGWRPSKFRQPALISEIYPVTERLSEIEVPSASTVRIRGFALTWIDAVLALTEGRGGQFMKVGENFVYRASGREPSRIIPWSRSGRPMLAKPDRQFIDWSNETAAVWTEYRRRIYQIERSDGGIDFGQTIWPFVLRAADSALSTIGVHDDAGRWFQQWSDTSMSRRQAESAMRDSYATAVGKRRPGPAWALGEAWRQVYPALVNRISHGGLAASSWYDFKRIATEMERIAFGPPAENLGRILALIDAGIVDLCDESHAPSNADVRVDAVIPSPYDWPENSPLNRLNDQQLLSFIDGVGGIRVDRCGRPIDSGGRTVEGLAILGRPTEGCIVGNDTLSRTLHQHPEKWAETVASCCEDNERQFRYSCSA